MGRFRGFTLIELLVVISIVALLTAILLPALGKARGTARAAVCLSNQRQLAMATQSYLQDYRYFFPQPGQDGDMDPIESGRALWFNALDYYLQQQKKNYAHGVDTERNYREFKHDPVWRDWTLVQRETYRSIKMNEFFGHPTSTSGAGWAFYREQDVQEPSRTALYVDGRSIDTPSNTGGIDFNGAQHFHVREVYVGLRHNQGANVTCVDGSARHHRNTIQVSGSGYSGWWDDDDPDPKRRPDVVFRFR